MVLQYAKYYTFIRRKINATKMHYDRALSSFKSEWGTYKDLNYEDDPNVPVINDRDNYFK